MIGHLCARFSWAAAMGMFRVCGMQIIYHRWKLCLSWPNDTLCAVEIGERCSSVRNIVARSMIRLIGHIALVLWWIFLSRNWISNSIYDLFIILNSICHYVWFTQSPVPFGHIDLLYPCNWLLSLYALTAATLTSIRRIAKTHLKLRKEKNGLEFNWIWP